MRMIKDLKDKVAVVTGGANGIGLAAVKRFLQEGMKVVIADIDVAALERIKGELNAGNRLHTIVCDVSTMDANIMLARETIDVFGGVNVVFLNAALLGSVEGWRASDITEKAWRMSLGVSLDGCFYGQRAFMPYLEKEKDARIIFTCSAFSLMTGLGDPAPYYVCKAGLLSFAECLYYDLEGRDSHIGVTAVLPGNTHNGIYYDLKELLEQTKKNPKDWNSSEWGSRDYVDGLVQYFSTKGTPPDIIIDDLIEAIHNDKFYVTPNINHFWNHIEHRWANIRAGRNPSFLEKTPDVFKTVEQD